MHSGSGTKAKQVQSLLRLLSALGHHDLAECTSSAANTDSLRVVNDIHELEGCLPSVPL